MRLVPGVLALTLLASLAHAEDARTAEPGRPPAEVAHGKVPLRVVRVMPESHQALLFDRSRSTHVLAEVGGKVDGYTVESIDDDEVTLVQDGKQIVLAAPVRHGGESRRDHDRAPAPADHPAPDGKHPDTAVADPTPVDPYADPPVRVVEAPGQAQTIEPGDGGVRVAHAPAPGGPAAGDASASLEIRTPGIRVVQAPPGSAGAPPGPPTVASPASASAAGSLTPVAAAATAPAAPASAPAGSSLAVGPARQTPAGPAVAPASARPAPPRAGPARADRQTVDARALADIMTSESPSRAPRTTATTTATMATTATTGPTATAAPTPASAPAPSEIRTSGPPLPGALVLPRAELDAALSDFSGLTAAIHGSFSASGVVVDRVAPGSIFQRAGLRAGDVVTAVDGATLRSLDDAANLYARAAGARAITAQVLRGGKPVTLQVAIQ
ncbi:MAG TPA: PDZ domain-containing protein [Kofleriaceae bacterium]|nr:PDZ domain-containing protein [Kofleriaceae bacterium]